MRPYRRPLNPGGGVCPARTFHSERRYEVLSPFPFRLRRVHTGKFFLTVRSRPSPPDVVGTDIRNAALGQKLLLPALPSIVPGERDCGPTIVPLPALLRPQFAQQRPQLGLTRNANLGPPPSRRRRCVEG
jgi:hypothetical protein